MLYNNSQKFYKFLYILSFFFIGSFFFIVFTGPSKLFFFVMGIFTFYLINLYVFSFKSSFFFIPT